MSFQTFSGIGMPVPSTARVDVIDLYGSTHHGQVAQEVRWALVAKWRLSAVQVPVCEPDVVAIRFESIGRAALALSIMALCMAAWRWL